MSSIQRISSSLPIKIAIVKGPIDHRHASSGLQFIHAEVIKFISNLDEV